MNSLSNSHYGLTPASWIMRFAPLVTSAVVAAVDRLAETVKAGASVLLGVDPDGLTGLGRAHARRLLEAGSGEGWGLCMVPWSTLRRFSLSSQRRRYSTTDG